MKTIIFASFFLLLGFSAQGQVQTMNPARLFDHTSLHLRGRGPSRDEWKAFELAKKNNQVDQFLASKRTEYVQSPYFAELLELRLEDAFWIRPHAFSDVTSVSDSEKPYIDSRKDPKVSGVTTDALTELLYRISRQNLSWDYLLTNHSYELYGRTQDPNYSGFRFRTTDTDLDFMSLNIPASNQPSVVSETQLKLHLDRPQDDQLTAGTITTVRFFDRYVNSTSNHNRKRAAAIFRIFLCDPMTAQIPKVTTDDPFPEIQPMTSKPLTEAQLTKELKSVHDLHGSQADCRKCHYKLDPMGHVFAFSGMVLGSIPAPGKLTFKTSQNQLVDIPVRGFGDLGAAIVTRPEYVDCQVRNFWNWFVGEDIPLTSDTAKELALRFNEMGRKPQDFAKYLTTRPEFSTLRDVDSELAPLVYRTRELLKKCSDCHDDQNSLGLSEAMPRF